MRRKGISGAAGGAGGITGAGGTGGTDGVALLAICGGASGVTCPKLCDARARRSVETKISRIVRVLGRPVRNRGQKAAHAPCVRARLLDKRMHDTIARVS